MPDHSDPDIPKQSDAQHEAARLDVRDRVAGCLLLIYAQPLAGRTGAIMTLAGALAPAILAQLLGLSDTTASKWYRLAGGDYNRYAARTITTAA